MAKHRLTEEPGELGKLRAPEQDPETFLHAYLRTIAPILTTATVLLLAIATH